MVASQTPILSAHPHVLVAPGGRRSPDLDSRRHSSTTLKCHELQMQFDHNRRELIMRYRSIILLILAVLAGSCESAQCQAVVAGVVSDSGGHPLSGASVEAFPIESGGFAGDLNWTRTHDGGCLRLSLRPGRYEIRGKDEPDGYPDPNALLALDPEAAFPEVIVDNQEVQSV